MKRRNGGWKLRRIRDRRILLLVRFLCVIGADLSFMKVDVGRFVKCRWENLISIDFTYSQVDDQGWKEIVGLVREKLTELRKLNLCNFFF